jgi:hypothetical protein
MCLAAEVLESANDDFGEVACLWEVGHRGT